MDETDHRLARVGRRISSAIIISPSAPPETRIRRDAGIHLRPHSLRPCSIPKTSIESTNHSIKRSDTTCPPLFAFVRSTF
ncbi:hypothetical protein CPB86DRAFT_303237 [Serendipita vermifera]|nr:hypothetical protein CPB86DRAFT_303237 [Serendipita vermifera]